jgi:hypothetical protein
MPYTDKQIKFFKALEGNKALREKKNISLSSIKRMLSKRFKQGKRKGNRKPFISNVRPSYRINLAPKGDRSVSAKMNFDFNL